MIMERFSLKSAYKQMGVSYLGNVSHSHKLALSEKNGTMTYGIYLAPADMSGFNVCPRSEHCRDHCLNGSGQNRCDELAHGKGGSHINRSRIRKTQALFRNRRTFIRTMFHEIALKKRRAEEKGAEFASRLNCVSDLNPEIFRDPDTGKNVLETFPDVQFYDYTKVPSRIKLMEKYPNYDITFSYDGFNWDTCEEFLKKGGKVAVVFRNEKKLPKTYRGYPVHNGNLYDMRYLDPAGHIIGLTYHKTGSDYTVGADGRRKFVEPDTPFIVKDDDPFVVW